MLFATASHCGVEPGNSSTIVAYWNYEWPTCRTPGAAAGSQVNPPDASQTSSGAVYLAGTSDPFSAETCTATQAPRAPGPRSTTVRQTPSKAIEAPISMPSGS